MIRFKTQLVEIGSWTVLRLPKSASVKLPSRGMIMAKGTLDGVAFQAPLEPDGKGSHWFRTDKAMLAKIGAARGDTVTLAIEPTKDWPEPEVPNDVKSALSKDQKARNLWDDITPMARWDWLRWINSTGKSETRKRRIEVALSKLKAGNRRPCCFNRTMCTVPAVSKSGVLIEPA